MNDIPSEWLREAFEFAVANGWRPPAEEMSDEARERPTLPPTAMKLGLVEAA